jgi:hypothetical protein
MCGFVHICVPTEARSERLKTLNKHTHTHTRTHTHTHTHTHAHTHSLPPNQTLEFTTPSRLLTAAGVTDPSCVTDPAVAFSTALPLSADPGDFASTPAPFAGPFLSGSPAPRAHRLNSREQQFLAHPGTPRPEDDSSASDGDRATDEESSDPDPDPTEHWGQPFVAANTTTITTNTTTTPTRSSIEVAFSLESAGRNPGSRSWSSTSPAARTQRPRRRSPY